MKIWLNHILACPDDKQYPLRLRIFKWDNESAFFKKLKIAYEYKYLINFYKEDAPLEMQVYDPIIFNLKESNIKEENGYNNSNNNHGNSNNNVSLQEDKVWEENKRITLDLNFQNIINIFIEDNILKLKDYNVVNPSDVKSYFNYYQNIFSELKYVKDVSKDVIGRGILNDILQKFPAKFKQVYDKLFQNTEQINWMQFDEDKAEDEDEKTIVSKFLELIKPIFQDLLLLNYYLFVAEISEGILVCPSCNRWFPIINTIPRLFPAHVPRAEIDNNFYKRWKEKIPKDLR
ncbi:MAG: Trm112 family protein [Promethearchaeota archaeon]